MNMDEARVEVVKWYKAHLVMEKEQDLFASHVTEEMKRKYFEEQAIYIEEIKQGKHDSNFTVRQRLEYYMTGRCTPILNF